MRRAAVSRLLVPLAIAGAGAIGCGRATGPAAEEDRVRARPEFEAIATALENSENRYLGRRQVDRLQARLDQPGLARADWLFDDGRIRNSLLRNDGGVLGRAAP